MNVKQDTSRPAAAEAVKAPEGFSAETLPKPLQDAIHAGQMRVTENGEVQVYIELSAIDSQNLDEMRSYGVTLQIIGEPNPDKSNGEVLTKVPTVQGLLPVTMINQVSVLPFVRYIRLPDYGFTNTGWSTRRATLYCKRQRRAASSELTEPAFVSESFPMELAASLRPAVLPVVLPRQSRARSTQETCQTQ